MKVLERKRACVEEKLFNHAENLKRFSNMQEENFKMTLSNEECFPSIIIGWNLFMFIHFEV